MRKRFTFLLPVIFIPLLLPFASSAQNSAISLDGVSGYVSTAAAIVPVAGSDFTVEFWAVVPAINPTGQSIFVSQGTLGSNAFYIGYDGASGNITAGDGWPNTGVPMPIGTWTHIALTQTGGTVSLYVNDSLRASNTGYTIAAGGSDFQIGINADGASGFLAGEMDELRIWSLVRTEPQLKSNWYTISPSTSGLIAYYPMNAGSGTTLANSTGTTGLDGTLQNTAAWASSPIQSGSNALAFDDLVGTFIAAPAIPAYVITTGTVELWANPNSDLSTSVNSDMVGIRSQGVTRFSFHMGTNNIGLWNNYGYLSLPFTPVPGTWYHIAFVIDGTMDTVGVFVDGGAYSGYLGQLAEGVNTTAPSYDSLVIGISENYGANSEPFPGILDEIRIWNTMQTPAQISTYENATLTGNESGLVALFSFDQGVPGGNNSFLTTAIDGTPNNNHGTMVNFNLSNGNTSSNFIAHTFTPLPVNFTRFIVSNVQGTALLQWQTAQEQNSRDYSIQRSADGNAFTDIGAVPAAGNSSVARNYSFTDAAPLNGNNYYRLKETDLDGQFMYSDIKLLTFAAASNHDLVWFKTGDKAVEVDFRQGSNELYSVVDMNGHIIREGQLSAGRLYLSGIASGIYSVKVLAASGVLQTKVLVQ